LGSFKKHQVGFCKSGKGEIEGMATMCIQPQLVASGHGTQKMRMEQTEPQLLRVKGGNQEEG